MKSVFLLIALAGVLLTSCKKCKGLNIKSYYLFLMCLEIIIGISPYIASLTQKSNMRTTEALVNKIIFDFQK